jgi:hypothetical protein
MIDDIFDSFGLVSTEKAEASIYLLLNDNLSPGQGKSVTDLIAHAGYGLAILAGPQILIVDGDSAARDTFSSLIGTTVLAIGIDDVSPLLEAATTPQLTAQITALQVTTPSAQNAAEMTRPYAGEDWRGLCANTTEE